MAKIQIKSEKLTPFVGIFHVMKFFERHLSLHQQDTLERIYTRLEGKGITINRSRMDCGSCSENTVFLLITALIRNFYQFLVQAKDLESRHVEFYSGELLYALYGVRGCCTPKDANRKDRSRF